MPKKSTPPATPKRTPRRIIRDVASSYGLVPADLSGPGRSRFLSRARRHVIHELRGEYPELSWEQIGNLLNKHHTSVLYLAGRVTGKVPHA